MKNQQEFSAYFTYVFCKVHNVHFKVPDIHIS